MPPRNMKPHPSRTHVGQRISASDIAVSLSLGDAGSPPGRPGSVGPAKAKYWSVARSLGPDGTPCEVPCPRGLNHATYQRLVTNTTACLQSSLPCPTGNSGRIYGQPTSTSSSTASCVFDVDSGCRRRNRRPGAGTGRAMPRSSWASPQNPSCAGQRSASCAASALAIGLTDTTPTRNCYACGTG